MNINLGGHHCVVRPHFGMGTARKGSYCWFWTGILEGDTGKTCAMPTFERGVHFRSHFRRIFTFLKYDEMSDSAKIYYNITFDYA